LVSLSSIHEKLVEQLTMGSISKHMKDKNVIRSSQHGFTKGKSCFTDMIALYSEVTSLVHVGRPVDVVSLDLDKVFDSVSHNILVDN